LKSVIGTKKSQERIVKRQTKEWGTGLGGFGPDVSGKSGKIQKKKTIVGEGKSRGGRTKTVTCHGEASQGNFRGRWC